MAAPQFVYNHYTLYDAKLPHLPAKQKPQNANDTRAMTRTKPYILIADTSPYILNHLASIFELANYNVRVAKIAEECIEIFRGMKEKLDIVLLDSAIAGEKGVGVILTIRREKPEQKILVVVEEDNARADAMRVGADVVVMKPITPEAILQKATEMLLEKETFLERKRAKYRRR
jgi:DNA-binding response OmpR family regulator